jgi:prevent-host-death family protein
MSHLRFPLRFRYVDIIRYMRVSIADAQSKLSQLIKAVEDGEAVTICRDDVPVADLVPTKEADAGSRGKPKFGTMKGRIVIHDPDWWKAEENSTI